MTQKSREFIIDMLEKEIEKELEYLEDEKHNSYNGRLNDDEFSYVEDVKDALFDLYQDDLKKQQGFNKMVYGINYKDNIKKINEKLKELRGE